MLPDRVRHESRRPIGQRLLSTWLAHHGGKGEQGQAAVITDRAGRDK